MTLSSILGFWCTMGVNIGLGFYIYKWKAIVEKFEVESQWVLLLCMILTLSHVKLTKALRTDDCIVLLVFFFFSHQASRSVCLWWLMGRWKRDVQRHCYLLAVSVDLSAVLSVESLPDI